MSLHILYLSLLCFLTTSLFCQVEKPRHCASHYWDSLTLAQSSEYAEARQSFEKKLSSYIKNKKKSGTNTTVYQIPVVVHVIHDNSSNTIGGFSNSNISDAQIYSQIEVLNEDFRRTNTDASQTSTEFLSIASDTEIDFCLATIDPNGNVSNGITRHFSSSLPFNPNNTSDNKELKSFGYWPADQYLNIWVSELSEDILGYATFPSDVSIDGLGGYFTDLTNDGVVLDYRAFGRTGSLLTNYNLGRTGTHEVGHWLGLFHTWGDEDNCFATDYCDDTPNQFTSSSGCPNSPFSCNSRDMSENYMDYSYDRCLNAFTADQKDRMRAVIENSPRRNALLNSLGCCTIDKTTNLPFTEDFETGFDTTDLWSVSTTNFALTNSPSVDDFSLAVQVTTPYPDTFSLTTPLIDLTELNTPYLSFLCLSNDANAHLQVSFSLACTQQWTPLINYDSFISNEWNSKNFDLNSIKNSSAVRLRFEYINSNNSPFYLDDINIHDENKKLQTYIYPNPSTAIFNINLRYEQDQAATIKVYSTLGNCVAQFEFEKSFSSTKQVDLSSLPSGLYLFKITVGEDTEIQKVTLTK